MFRLFRFRKGLHQNWMTYVFASKLLGLHEIDGLRSVNNSVARTHISARRVVIFNRRNVGERHVTNVNDVAGDVQNSWKAFLSLLLLLSSSKAAVRASSSHPSLIHRTPYQGNLLP
jgi:hypothetical protein